MKHFLSIKIVLILLFALILGFFDLPSEKQQKIIPNLPESIKEIKVNLGLDLQGGTQLTYKIDLSKVEETDQQRITDGVKEVITKRVNELGVNEPNIYTSQYEDETHIVVELAGIKDIEEAKAIVGKVIQLEFKEQKTKADENETNNIQAKANETLQKLLTGEDFDSLGKQVSEENQQKIYYNKSENFKFKDEFVQIIQENLDKLTAGQTYSQVIKGSNGYTLTESGLQEQTGFFILKLNEKQTQTREITHDKSVEVSHILISHADAKENTTGILRPEEDALKLANEIIAQLNNGTSFEELAKQYSDDTTKENGGVLEEAVTKDSGYVPDFTSAALALNSDGDFTQEPVKTEFGYHIIKANKITPESTETKEEMAYKVDQIFFSAVPDPWQETALTGAHFEYANVEFNNLYQPYVSIKFNEEGAKLFESLTEKNIGKPLAIFVGGQLISAPTVQDKISGGQAQITGQFSLEEANNLARDLVTGAIPAPISLSGQYTIGSVLGTEAFNSSIKASIFGLIVLALFMIVYYRIPGLIANFALGIYAIILMFLVKVSLPLLPSVLIAGIIFLILMIKIIQNDEDGLDKLISFVMASFTFFFLAFLLATPITLTLAGFAGIIMSIGMAVDANILIFERIKEELREGGVYSASIQSGLKRAWLSIRDSNFSTLITCVILMLLGSSIIKGFAFNLAAGVLVSMFTAITISYAFLQIFKHTKLKENKWLFGGLRTGQVYKPLNIDFIGKRKIWFAISGITALISIIAYFVIGFNLGIDFKGGTLMELRFPSPITSEEIQGTLTQINENLNANLGENEKLDFSINPEILASGENTYILRLKSLENTTHDQVLEEFKIKYEETEELRLTSIGPKIGKTIAKRAYLALFVALIGVVFYIAFAFRKIPRHLSPWKFSLSALICVAHDLILVSGIFIIIGFLNPNAEIDTLFITTLLTLIGYSINDTIVVFDRIRENTKNVNSHEKLIVATNKSLNETLGRSINTSFTTILPLIAILFFGSSSIFFFVLALTIGIIIGTFSSIFVASPILIELQKK